jgi:hypothetical protein
MKRTIIAALLLTTTTAHAAFWSGEKLYGHLTEPAGVNKGAAYGFIIGVHDLGENAVHCSPEDINVKIVIDVVRSYLEQNPESRRREAQFLVTRALQAKWPCPSKGSST